MDEIDTGRFELGDGIAKAAEIYGQHTGCDFDREHGRGGHEQEGIRAAYARPMTSTRPTASRRVRLRIERVVAGGDGLARASDGRVVFVPGVLPGEEAEVELVGAKRDFARGRVLDLVTPSAQRVAPRCPAVARGCGGCDWQHVDGSAQLGLKLEIVREALRRTGRVVEPDVVGGGGVDPFGYRTTMRFALDDKGRPALRRARSNEPVTIDDCLVAHPLLASLLADLRVHGSEEITLRVSVATGQRTAWSTSPDARIEGLPDDVRVGVRAHLVERVEGVAVQVTAGSFFQSGPAAAGCLVAAVRAACGDALISASTVVDAYGGVGLFAATVVPASGRVVVVEGSAAACSDALVNLAGRRARVDCTTVERWEPEPADLVIADPSRDGLGVEAVARLAATGAAVLVLVSCDPVSLARDVTLLRAAGYAPGTTTVLDLFPQTHHVEAVTRFERLDGAGG
jgi:23S rRNA (uracil1939-C5)-methyltransferase